MFPDLVRKNQPIDVRHILIHFFKFHKSIYFHTHESVTVGRSLSKFVIQHEANGSELPPFLIVANSRLADTIGANAYPPRASPVELVGFAKVGGPFCETYCETLKMSSKRGRDILIVSTLRRQ